MEGGVKLKVKIDVPLYDRGRALRFPPMEFVKIISEKREITYTDLKDWDLRVKDFIKLVDEWRKDVINTIDSWNNEDTDS